MSLFDLAAPLNPLTKGVIAVAALALLGGFCYMKGHEAGLEKYYELKSQVAAAQNRPRTTPFDSEPPKSRLIETLQTVGLLLLLIGAITLSLSGCCQPEVVYRKPEPYPLPPANLMRPPLNQDLVPSTLRPTNASSASITRSSMLPK